MNVPPSSKSGPVSVPEIGSVTSSVACGSSWRSDPMSASSAKVSLPSAFGSVIPRLTLPSRRMCPPSIESVPLAAPRSMSIWMPLMSRSATTLASALCTRMKKSSAVGAWPVIMLPRSMPKEKLSEMPTVSERSSDPPSSGSSPSAARPLPRSTPVWIVLLRSSAMSNRIAGDSVSRAPLIVSVTGAPSSASCSAVFSAVFSASSSPRIVGSAVGVSLVRSNVSR